MQRTNQWFFHILRSFFLGKTFSKCRTTTLSLYIYICTVHSNQITPFCCRASKEDWLWLEFHSFGAEKPWGQKNKGINHHCISISLVPSSFSLESNPLVHWVASRLISHGDVQTGKTSTSASDEEALHQFHVAYLGCWGQTCYW